MGALVPIVVVVVLEGIVLKTNHIFHFIENRLGFWTSGLPEQHEELRVVDISNPRSVPKLEDEIAEIGRAHV